LATTPVRSRLASEFPARVYIIATAPPLLLLVGSERSVCVAHRHTA